MLFGREQFHNPEFNYHLVEAYAQTFIHRRDCYPMQLEEGNYVTLHKPLKPEIIAAHIKGTVTIGAYALDENSMAHWLCLDADEDETWQRLIDTAQQLETSGVVPYLEPSRRGGHLWLFTPALPGKIVREFGKGLVIIMVCPSRLNLSFTRNRTNSKQVQVHWLGCHLAFTARAENAITSFKQMANL